MNEDLNQKSSPPVESEVVNATVPKAKVETASAGAPTAKVEAVSASALKPKTEPVSVTAPAAKNEIVTAATSVAKHEATTKTCSKAMGVDANRNSNLETKTVQEALPPADPVNNKNVLDDKLTIIILVVALIAIALSLGMLLAKVPWKIFWEKTTKLFRRSNDDVSQNLTGETQGTLLPETEEQNEPVPVPKPIENKSVPAPKPVKPAPSTPKAIPQKNIPPVVKAEVGKSVPVKKVEETEEYKKLERDYNELKKRWKGLDAAFKAEQKNRETAEGERDRFREESEAKQEVLHGLSTKHEEEKTKLKERLRDEFERERKELQRQINEKEAEISRVRGEAERNIRAVESRAETEKSEIEIRWQKKFDDEQTRSREALAKKNNEISQAWKNAEERIRIINAESQNTKTRLEAEKLEIENRSRKALEAEQERSRNAIATEQSRFREALAEKDREILRERKICSEVLGKMWPDFNSVPEVAEMFRTWESEIKSKSESEISPAVKGILARLFVWKAAVAMKDEKQQQNALVEFTRSFFAWSNAIGKSSKDAENDARKIAKLFNETLIPAAGAAYKIYLPEVNAPYDASRAQPALSSKSKFGRIYALESCGILSSANKILSKANVMLS